ncbi:hypothetical protein ZIOFF_061706 [Zingiber officinale]|uniref:Uncharacterized protein n=1 Tax=Zingiber officinale TaxID=94328 RepID=A0A8J5KA17_ZINOF|nr:hypothetical protein ZIOFF_061706 [Zingiber officinale]
MVRGRGRKGMPTPVSSARACLAAEAGVALDEGVAVARRRAHAQTTSLHVVYALLLQPAGGGGSGSGAQSASSSILRDALLRVRSVAYSARMQLRALERCFGMALDRLPSSSGGQREGGGDEPPVSNSLMAAIKRSQANQRRNPESFHLYQQQQQQNAATGVVSTFSGVKVEMQQMVLAILDDPIVSRVFGDAGFRSVDVKFAILRPPPTILRFPRAAKCAPLFLCNFSAGDGFEAPVTARRIAFPFAPEVGQLCSDGGDENCRRIGDILSRKGGATNPMLIGVGAAEAAKDFAQAVERKNWAILPLEIRGIELVSIEKLVAEFSTGRCELSAVDARLMELEKEAAMPGVVVNIGDLKEMVECKAECDEHERCLISDLTRLLEVYQGRLWVMAWSATYETYMKFLSRHPLLDKDWNLQLLPITSVRSGMGSSLPRPPRNALKHYELDLKLGSDTCFSCLMNLNHAALCYSMMESFVPFGGFFPTACESKDIGSSVSPPASRCELCNDKYEEELSILLKGQSSSVCEKKKDTLPFWLQKANTTGLNNEYNAAQAKDDNGLLNAKSMELKNKWNEVCRQLHNCHTRKTVNYPEIPCTTYTSSISYKNRASSKVTEKPEDSQTLGNSLSISVGTQTVTMASQSISLPLVVESRKNDLLPKHQVRLSKSEQLQRVDLPYHQGDEHASPSSITSVATNLVLGNLPEPLSKEEKPAKEVQKSNVDKISSCLPSVDTAKRNVSDVRVAEFSCSSIKDYQAKSGYPVNPIHSFSQVSNGRASSYDKSPLLVSSSIMQNIDLSSYKSFCKSLIDKVGRQEEAVIAISQAIFRCKLDERRRGRLRRDIWLNFHGPDKMGKKRVAVALSELIHGSKDNLICIDLSYEDGVARPSSICAQQEVTEKNVQFRGKLNVDLIAEGLSKRSYSVVFLENVDKADFLVQQSLSQAIHTGKFPDSHGREFSINNAIFILTWGRTIDKNLAQGGDYSSFYEETILAAQCWQMKICLEACRETNSSSPKSSAVSFISIQKHSTSQVYLQSSSSSKRKVDLSDDCDRSYRKSMSSKRTHTMPKGFLDLNMPIEEVETEDDHNDSSSLKENYTSDNSEPWIKEFCDQVDATVNFTVFDFNALANNILEAINRTFRSTLGSEYLLEIDRKVMELLLAVAWSSEDRGPLDNWFEQVLGRSFRKMKHKNSQSSNNILKLVCEDALVEEHAPGVMIWHCVVLKVVIIAENYEEEAVTCLILLFKRAVGAFASIVMLQRTHQFQQYIKNSTPLCCTFWTGNGVTRASIDLRDNNRLAWRNKAAASPLLPSVALRIHKEAEKKRRERINAHFSTLRRLVPNSAKMDKACLLGRVIDQVKELNRKVTDISQVSRVPKEVNEVSVVECSISHNDDDDLYMKASVCCEDRPDLFAQLTEAFQKLRLRTIKAEVVSLGGRTHGAFLLCLEERKENACVSSFMESLRRALDAIASENKDEPSEFSSKRRRMMQIPRV